MRNKNNPFAFIRALLAFTVAILASTAFFAPAAATAAGKQADIAALLGGCEWHMHRNGNLASVYTFDPDFTWNEKWNGMLKTGSWKQTASDKISIGGYEFVIEDKDSLRRNDGQTWKRASAAAPRLAPREATAPADPASLRKHILTPPPPDTPRINGPRVFGARPGSVFLYTIPATGKRPMTFSADGLPAGLKLDPATGRITGRAAAAGDYKVTLRVTNALGEAIRPFTIKIGGKIALTPPLGWSSWNAYGDDVSQANVIAVARAFVSTGLINHGWSYINIDDCWQGERGGKHNAIMPNSKFPDMKKLADEIHALGLKLGIYSAPWRGTYAGYIGSYSDNADGSYDWIKRGQHTEHYRFTLGNPIKDRRIHYKHGKHSFVKNDVAQWMEWGIDYLKYDWSPNDYRHTKEMLDALRTTDRDIVYSLSNSAPFADAMLWAEMSNVYRTTGDIRDTWKSVSALGFNHSKWAAFSGPGHWADPDMLVVGHVGGWTGGVLHYTNLTADEQYTHMSLWALLSAPLLLGCDLPQIDDFTLSLLTNDEVLDINQDPLGVIAMPLVVKGDTVVYAKQLEDGSMAVGLFNKGAEKREVAFTLKQLGLRGKQTIRDVWRQKDIATTSDNFSATVNPHGVLLLRLSPGNERK